MHSTQGFTHFSGWIVALLLLVSSANAYTSLGRSGGGCVFSRLGKGSSRHQETTKSSSRRLQQSDCSLELSGTPYTFTACQDYSSTLQSDLILHYSVTEGENGGNITFRGGIDAAYTEGESDYVGFGFEPDLAMIGGNVVIVQACSECESGASIDDYYLSEQDISGVNAPSQMEVPFKSAALSGGRFRAVFDLVLSSEQASVSSAGAIFAAGPVSSSGELEQHFYVGAEILDMTPGVTSDLGEALSPLEASAPTADSPSPSPSTTESTAEAPAAAPRSDLSSCGLEYSGNNSVLSFTGCRNLPTAGGSSVQLFWNLQSDPSGSGTLLHGALETTQSNRWAGFGFPATPGRMLGARSIIVHPCSSCSSGAEADRYLLADYEASAINSGTSDLELISIEASEREGGGVQALFTLRLEEDLSELGTNKDIIAAVGGSTGAGNLNSHNIRDAYTGTVNFLENSGEDGSTSRSLTRRVVVHGGLMIAGWGLVLPLGVVFARCKEWGQIWFQLHRAFQVIGYCAGFAGAGLGWSFKRPTGTDLEQDHRIVGWTVWLLLSIQMLSLFWRPKPGKNKLRRSWAAGHWIAGTISVFMAFANVFIGLRVSEQRKLWSGLYALAFGLIVLLWVLKMGYNQTVLRNQKRRSMSHQTFKSQSDPSRSSSDEVMARTKPNGVV